MSKDAIWWIVFVVVLVSALTLISALQTLWEEFKNKEVRDE